MTTPDIPSHPDESLIDLATGQPVPDEVPAHVAGCARCAAELDALRDLVQLSREPVPALVAPPPALWDAIAAEVDRAHEPAPLRAVPAEDDAPGRRPSVVTALPTRGDREQRRRGTSPWWVGAAAAAGLVVGGVGVGVLQQPEADPSPSAVVVGRADLDTLDTQQAFGAASAERVDGRLDLAVDTPAVDPGSGYLEVWLINRDLSRMVAVGVLRPQDGVQRFPLDQALLDQGYVIVDISREAFDDRPAHSGDSVARGTLST